MAGTPRPKRVVAVSGVVVACRSEKGARRSCSRRRNRRTSVGFYVPMLPPDGRPGIPKNHLNLARIRFHTSSPARSPERPSLRRHLNVKRNKSSIRTATSASHAFEDARARPTSVLLLSNLAKTLRAKSRRSSESPSNVKVGLVM